MITKKPSKTVPRIIEYDDMTDHQKMIADGAVEPAVATIPHGLTSEERLRWLRERWGIN